MIESRVPRCDDCAIKHKSSVVSQRVFCWVWWPSVISDSVELLRTKLKDITDMMNLFGGNRDECVSTHRRVVPTGCLTRMLLYALLGSGSCWSSPGSIPNILCARSRRQPSFIVAPHGLAIRILTGINTHAPSIVANSSVAKVCGADRLTRNLAEARCDAG